MSARRRLERASDDRRPVVTDDFVYDEPDQDINYERRAKRII